MPQTYLGAVRVARRTAVGRVARRAGAAIPERARDRRRRDHAPGADDHRTGREGGRVRVPVHAGRRTAGAAGGDRRHAGRAPLRRGDPAHARRVASGSSPPRRSPSSSCWARSPACSRRRARRRPATCSSDRVFQIPFSPNPMVWLYGLRWRRARRDARRVARHARHDAPAAARRDPAARLIARAAAPLVARRGRTPSRRRTLVPSAVLVRPTVPLVASPEGATIPCSAGDGSRSRSTGSQALCSDDPD